MLRNVVFRSKQCPDAVTSRSPSTIGTIRRAASKPEEHQRTLCISRFHHREGKMCATVQRLPPYTVMPLKALSLAGHNGKRTRCGEGRRAIRKRSRGKLVENQWVNFLGFAHR